MNWLAAHPWIEFLLVGTGLVLDAILGAWISTKVRQQLLPIWITFLSGNISIMMWAYLARYSKMKLVAASLFFDVVYNTAWMLALVYFGTKLNSYQMLGVALVVIGIALFGIGD